MLNHFATIWTAPRATIREVLATKSGWLFLPLAAIYGIVHNLHMVMRHELDPTEDVTVLGIILANIGFGVLFGIGIFFVSSYLLAGVGRLFGGNPSSRSARVVLAWASVPYLPLLVVIIPLMLVAGDALIFNSQQDVFRGVAGAGPQLASLIYFLGRGIMVIWSVVIAVLCLSEAFGISSGKSFLVFVISGAVTVALGIGALGLLGTIGLL